MNIPYIDTHLDTMWQSQKSKRTFGQDSTEGHIDLKRARQAGLAVGFFTGFPTDDAPVTETMMASFLKYFLHDSEAKINQITNLRELDEHMLKFNKMPQDQLEIGAVLHFEGAAGIDLELNKLFIYHGLGLRSMSLTWNETNHWATGAKNESDRGLTQDGRNLLSAMVDLGIMIDVSHLNDTSFWDVQGAIDKPIFASHSNLRTEASAHKRNLTPEMVQAIADSNGSVGVNFCTAFLRDEENSTSMSTVINMINSIIQQVGVNHVHIGSDMDGCTLPPDMSDITIMPKLFEELQEQLNLSPGDIEKITFKNMRRVMESYWYKL